jgi:hypothetical protein
VESLDRFGQRLGEVGQLGLEFADSLAALAGQFGRIGLVVGDGAGAQADGEVGGAQFDDALQARRGPPGFTRYPARERREGGHCRQAGADHFL